VFLGKRLTEACGHCVTSLLWIELMSSVIIESLKKAKENEA